MATQQTGSNAPTCGCPADGKSSEAGKPTSLEDLIPIAVVIAAACESCAEKMVTRALEQGSSWRDVQTTLGVVAHMRKLGCFTQAVGVDVVARMEKPLAAGKKTLQQALARLCG